VTKARTKGEAKRAKQERRDQPEVVAKPAVEPKTIGPTPEAMRHGEYVRGDGARAVYTNNHANVLAKLRGHRTITQRQHAAGLCFERTWVAVWGSASPSRDSTIPPIGGTVHETDDRAERMARYRARLNTILNRVGPARYSLLVSVAVFGEGLGRERGNELAYEALRACLDQCAIAYGLPEEAAA
jgi:hypothetical protein